MKKSTATLITLSSLALLLPSCNTFVGVGQDFKRLGEGVENKARGNTWNGQPQSTYTPPSTYVPQ